MTKTANPVAEVMESEWEDYLTSVCVCTCGIYLDGSTWRHEGTELVDCEMHASNAVDFYARFAPKENKTK